MDSGAKMLEEVALEMASVKTPKFFFREREDSSCAVSACEERFGSLPSDYSKFLNVFGAMKLFRDTKRRRHTMRVGAPHVIELSDGKVLIEIGFCWWGNGAYYMPSAGRTPPSVFEMRGAGFVSVADSFNTWFKKKWDKCRKQLGNRRWQAALDGPKPFSAEEALIAESADLFEVQQLGVADNGGVKLLVKNCSSICLPAITIHAEVPRGMYGLARLAVAGIQPNEEVVKEFVWFPGVDSKALVVRKVPKAGPEDRHFYHEFRALYPRE
jgi:hypothetical protein